MGERIEIKVGETDRIAFVRILPHSNLVKAILQSFQQTGFSAAFVPNGIGSLESTHYTFITKNGTYHKPILLKENCELLGLSGFIAKNPSAKNLPAQEKNPAQNEGRSTIEYHFHAILANGTGCTFGGHLLEEGNLVCATVELTLVEMKGIHIKKEFDKETGFTLFKVKP